MEISLRQARRIAVNSQLLDSRSRLPKGKEGIARTIEKLGYIQIDTISVIRRAHHHTIWTRCPDYDPRFLHELQAIDRRIFEYWGHAASYLPITDFRYYLLKMKSFYRPKQGWLQNSLKKCEPLLETVKDRIRSEGPLSSKDFEMPPGQKRGPWWNWKPYKAALEHLFWRGELMITERRKFSRVYDLTERVLPEGIDKTMPDTEELGRFLVRRTLKGYGIATENEIREHIQSADKSIITQGIRNLIDSGEVIILNVEENANREYCALASRIKSLARLRKTPPRLHLLSPFDNLIIQRERIKNIFGFDYALECYVTPSKRKFGYFALPILWGEEFVGKLDPKADRTAKTLIIRNLGLEKGFKVGDDFMPALADKLWDLARFNSCEKITLEKISPIRLKKSLTGQIRLQKPTFTN